MRVTTKYLDLGLTVRLAAAAALAVASTAACAVMVPLSDGELSAQHAAGLTLPGLDGQSKGPGAEDALAWLRSQQDLLKSLEHQQQSQNQQRVATASLQISSSVSYSVGLASLAMPLGPLFLPLMALPTPQLVALLPSKDGTAKNSPPKGP